MKKMAVGALARAASLFRPKYINGAFCASLERNCRYSPFLGGELAMCNVAWIGDSEALPALAGSHPRDSNVAKSTRDEVLSALGEVVSAL